jgi:hypothetical protein
LVIGILNSDLLRLSWRNSPRAKGVQGMIGGSVVSHHHLSSQGRGERDRFPHWKLQLRSLSRRRRCRNWTGGKRRDITSRQMRAPERPAVIAAVSSNHAKAALLAVGGRLFQSFKRANPRIIDFGLPVESGLSLFVVAESEPLLRNEVLDDHSQPSPFGPKSDGGTFTSVNLNFFLIPHKECDGVGRTFATR